MKNDKSINNNGCSVCANGKENYTTFRPAHHPNQPFYKYDYRHTDGELFSTVAATLSECRNRRDKWLERRRKMYKLFIGFRKLGEFDSILEAKQFADNSGLTGIFSLRGEEYFDSWYATKKCITMKTTITDINGTSIEVTDLNKAIEQCELCKDSPYKMPSGQTVGENHRYMLSQLEKLKHLK